MLEFSGSRIVSTNMDFIYIVPCFFIPFFLASKLFRSYPPFQVKTFWVVFKQFPDFHNFYYLSRWNSIDRNCIFKAPSHLVSALSTPYGAEIRTTKRIQSTQLR